jgi:hypothetical protein
MAAMTPRSTHRRLRLCLAVAAIAAVAVGGWYWYVRKSYRPPPLTFDGTSDQLLQTVIVPTLNSPIPEGKSAVWCVSFQLAWNRLKDDVVKEPIQLANAQPVADRLNRADQTETDLEPESVYAAAGLVRDGIIDRIRGEMARRFPDAPRPDLDASVEAIAYAYLAASAKYEHPYFENDEPFLFKDAAGKETSVGSFGIRKKDDYAYEHLRQQVQVLYRTHAADRREEVPEFVLDLCKTSEPYQIVVARVDRKPTLAETLADIQNKIASAPEEGLVSGFITNDALLVPNMAWQVTHRFKELEGRDKQFQNPALRGLHLDVAVQTIRFRLDRSGAELSSEAKLYAKPSPSHYYVNRPFLVYMQKRGGKHPFFVAWIENAELLQKK